MTDLTLIPDGGMPWLDASGPHADLVLSTRVRLARNLADVPFRGRNTAAHRERVIDQVAAAAAQAPAFADAALYRLDTLPPATRQWLSERQLVSRDLAGLGDGGRARGGGALLLAREASAMLNEEDHLRLQSFHSGFALSPAYAAVAQADHDLGLRVSFAFHPEFGYLTACPTNVGTGMRASVLIHLPALSLTREIGKVLHGLAQVGLTSRGLFGEGSDALGQLYQLSNQTTLGQSEGELLDRLGRMVRQVMEYETRARDVLVRDARGRMDDGIWRAWAILRYARALSFDELVNLLGNVRLGVTMHVLPAMPLYTLNRLLVISQPAHVAAAAGVNLDDESLSEHRATLVRRMLGETETV